MNKLNKISRANILKMFSVVIFFFSSQSYAQTQLCQDVFKAETAPYRVTMADLKNAFRQIDKAFIDQLDNEYGADFSEPHNAFFFPEGGFEEGQTWRGSERKLRLTKEQLDSSWSAPLYLQPMEIALYKGTLFPSAYFIRRTSSGNGLNRNMPYDFPSFGEKLPYAIVRGSNVDIHSSGGSKKMFELWAQDHSKGDGYVTLHRAASKFEYQVQVLIQNLKKEDLAKPVNAHELSVLEKISKSVGEAGHNNEKSQLDWILKNSQSASRQEFVSRLIESVGFFSGGIFTTDNRAAVNEFKSSDSVIISYKIPLAKLQELVVSNEAYFGIEYNYFEIAFIDNPKNQRAKNLVLDSIVEAH